MAEQTGIGAYALYTDACLAAMALDDPAAAGLVRHVEAFDDVGEIGGWVVDLRAAWVAEQERGRIVACFRAAPGEPCFAAVREIERRAPDGFSGDAWFVANEVARLERLRMLAG